MFPPQLCCIRITCSRDHEKIDADRDTSINTDAHHLLVVSRLPLLMHPHDDASGILVRQQAEEFQYNYCDIRYTVPSKKWRGVLIKMERGR